MSDICDDTCTVVVSTFGRPQALAAALKSVAYQSHPHWLALVIGDHCDHQTLEAIKPFLSDQRFQYVNLPFRCGEQSYPNSAGMAAASTKWIALLNHDDIWMPWHLDASIKSLKTAQADLSISRSAWTWGEPVVGREAPFLKGVTPESRNCVEVFKFGYHLIEPASSWVFNRNLVERVGLWSPSTHIFRRPIHDWFLRAWRSGTRINNLNLVTTIKFENHWRNTELKFNYATSAQPQAAWVQRLSAEALRIEVMDELYRLCDDPSAVGRGMNLTGKIYSSPEIGGLQDRLLTDEFADFYFRTGLDSYTWMCAEAGLPRGFLWRIALQARTGESIMEQPNMDDVVTYVKNALTQSKRFNHE